MSGSAAAKNVSFGARFENIIQSFSQNFWIHLEYFENLRNDPFGLFDQRQQHMFGIDLIMPIALDNLGCSLGSFLSSLCKSIKSHHKGSVLKTELFVNSCHYSIAPVREFAELY